MIAVATLGVRLGLLDRVLESQVIVLAAVTSTLAPSLFRVLCPGPEPPRAPRPAGAALDWP